MNKVVYYWEWSIHEAIGLTLDKTYTVIDKRVSVRDEYLIKDDYGDERWYAAFLFKDISELRDEKLEEILNEKTHS